MDERKACREYAKRYGYNSNYIKTAEQLARAMYRSYAGEYRRKHAPQNLKRLVNEYWLPKAKAEIYEPIAIIAYDKPIAKLTEIERTALLWYCEKLDLTNKRKELENG